jgi:hypothetical protein
MIPLTATTGALYIEAEDFDFDRGKYVTDQPIGVTGPYKGGAYQGKGATNRIDYFEVNNANDQNVYRAPTGVEAGKRGTTAAPATDGLARAGFNVEINHIVGWNDAGDWYNYTRQIPQNDYYVIGRLSSGEPNNPIKAQLDQVTAGVGTTNQTLKKLGTFNANTTANWDTFTFITLRDDAGNVIGKGTAAHAAAVVGDTVGDPVNDTAGPSLHVLVKLLSTITLVLAPLFI